MGEDSARVVTRVTVEDAVTGVHEGGPYRAALVLCFEDGDGECVTSAVGSFCLEDLVAAASEVARVSAVGDRGDQGLMAQALVLGVMSGLADREAQAEMAAESAIREMEAGI